MAAGKTTKEAFLASIPVMFGYLPTSATYGMLFVTELDLHWLWAPLTSALVFAGAAQFLAIGLMAAHAAPVTILVTALLLNIRHVFYGLSFPKRFDGNLFRKSYQIFALTDETYSLLSSHKPKTEDKQFCLLVTSFNHAYWVLGTTLGAYIGSRLTMNTSGMDFAVTAMFAVLTVEQWKATKKPFPFILAAIIGLNVAAFFKEHMLLVSIGLCTLLMALTYKRRSYGN